MRLSLCMIVRDEARTLAGCLASVSGLADELVVVDTGSADATVDIARAAGADVHRIDWPNDFAAARNASLERATGDWILVLDADEALAPGTADALRPWLATTRADGVRLVQRSFQPDGELCRYQDLLITRLFRNRPDYRYEGIIHEQIGPSILRAGGRVVDTPFVIDHDGYRTPVAQGSRSRAERNLSLLEAAVAAEPGDAYLHYQLGITCKSLGQAERARHHLRHALSLDSASMGTEARASLFMRLAQLELGADRYAQALGYAEQCLGLEPENVVALYVAAVSLTYLGRLREAEPYFVAARTSPNCSPDGLAQLDRLIAYCRRVA